MAQADYDFLLAEDIEADKEERIAAHMRLYRVNREVATIMTETGYSKGTCNRIISDRRRAETRAREVAHQAKMVKKEVAKVA